MSKVPENRRILRNRILCLVCGDTPESHHRHDLRFCRCGSVAADGGKAYLRRLGSLDSWQELAEHEPGTRLRQARLFCVACRTFAEPRNIELASCRCGAIECSVGLDGVRKLSVPGCDYADLSEYEGDPQ